MDRSAAEFVDVQWVARCARRLRRQWPHADVASLEEAAAELWRIDWLREMSAEEAAELWLQPLSCRPSGEIVQGQPARGNNGNESCESPPARR